MIQESSIPQEVSVEPDRIGVLGAGAIGTATVGRLNDEGHTLVIWNRSPRDAPLDATARDSASEVVQDCDVVIVSVSDGPAALEVLGQLDPLQFRSDAVVLVMSTVGEAYLAKIRSMLPQSVHLLDTPVMGAPASLREGTAHLFVGGDEADLARVEPILRSLGHIIRTGDLGSGQNAKLIANSVLFAVLTTVGEALAAATTSGMDLDVAFAVMDATPLAEASRRRQAAVVTDDYHPRFGLGMAAKDAELADDKFIHVKTPVLGAARRWIVECFSETTDNVDYTAALRHILQSPPRDAEVRTVPK